MSINNSLQKDIVTLNRRFLLVVRQMANAKHPLLGSCVPGWLTQKVCNMTLEEIDALAEDMTAPCFILNFHEANFEQAQTLPHGSRRKNYFTNALVSHQMKNA